MIETRNGRTVDEIREAQNHPVMKAMHVLFTALGDQVVEGNQTKDLANRTHKSLDAILSGKHEDFNKLVGHMIACKIEGMVESSLVLVQQQLSAQIEGLRQSWGENSYIRLGEEDMGRLREWVLAQIFPATPTRIRVANPIAPAPDPSRDADYPYTASEYANLCGASLDFLCESWKGKRRPKDPQAKYEGQVFCKDVALAMGYPPRGKNREIGEPPAHRSVRNYDENLHHRLVLPVWWAGLLIRLPNLLRDHPYVEPAR